MTVDPKALERLQFLARVVMKEARHLEGTTQRLFDRPFAADQVAAMESDFELAERVDAHAFVPALLDTANRLTAELRKRGWTNPTP